MCWRSPATPQASSAWAQWVACECGAVMSNAWRVACWEPRLPRQPPRLTSAPPCPPPPADNVPGVSGIGPKTAVALLRDHGSLDDLLAAAEQGLVKPKRAATQLSSGAQPLLLAGWLGVLGDDARALACAQPRRRAARAVQRWRPTNSSPPPRAAHCARLAAADAGRAAARLSQQLVRIETALDMPPVQEPLDSLR